MGLLPGGREEERGGCADDWLGVQRIRHWKLGCGPVPTAGHLVKVEPLGKVLDRMLTLRFFFSNRNLPGALSLLPSS